jgi:hypothetical protein
MGDTSGSIETREGSLDGEEREMLGDGVLGWVKVGACGQLICAYKPYSTGLPGSSTASICRIWGGEADARDGRAASKLDLAKVETHKKPWSPRSPKMVQRSMRARQCTA